MKRKDILVIVLIFVAAVGILFTTPQGQRFAAAALGYFQGEPAPVENEPEAPAEPPVLALTLPGEPLPTPVPTATPEPTAAPAPTLYPASSYLLVSTPQGVYVPIPLVEEGAFSLTQGEGVENVIEIGKDRIKMQSSTCENQDCVNQGEVTLQNRDMRVLGEWIICLPHQVTLQLLTPDEAQTVYQEMTQ